LLLTHLQLFQLNKIHTTDALTLLTSCNIVEKLVKLKGALVAPFFSYKY